jgi:hypothetical protein
MPERTVACVGTRVPYAFAQSAERAITVMHFSLRLDAA